MIQINYNCLDRCITIEYSSSQVFGSIFQPIFFATDTLINDLLTSVILNFLLLRSRYLDRLFYLF